MCVAGETWPASLTYRFFGKFLCWILYLRYKACMTSSECGNTFLSSAMERFVFYMQNSAPGICCRNSVMKRTYEIKFTRIPFHSLQQERHSLYWVSLKICIYIRSSSIYLSDESERIVPLEHVHWHSAQCTSCCATHLSFPEWGLTQFFWLRGA